MKSKIKNDIGDIKIDGVVAEELMKGEEPPKDEVEYVAKAKGFVPTTKQKAKHYGGKVFDFVSTTVLIGLVGSFSFSLINGQCKMHGVDSNRFFKNNFGVPITLPVNKNEIQVLIDKEFSDEQKNCIAKAIDEFDFDVKGVKYKVELDPSKAKNKSIRIKKATTYDKDGLAVTDLKSRGYFGYFQFPINIDVQVEKIMPTKISNKNNQRYLSSVIKHEMLHTLGLKDIYDKKMKQETLMYGINNNDGTTLYDLSESDKQIVNAVYRPIEDESVKYNVSTAVSNKMVVTVKDADTETFSL